MGYGVIYQIPDIRHQESDKVILKTIKLINAPVDQDAVSSDL